MRTSSAAVTETVPQWMYSNSRHRARLGAGGWSGCLHKRAAIAVF
ncbi:hypothetical protein N4G70_35165 [Streptomyces sp. ASQP_92]|nr:hypothetical protein [Streptomyces sp. ASQP_92]MCT9094057.1 hypothetical protein [Streptomyces sp. ASQP_92]